jgi:hypothetical protein
MRNTIRASKAYFILHHENEIRVKETIGYFTLTPQNEIRKLKTMLISPTANPTKTHTLAKWPAHTCAQR